VFFKADVDEWPGTILVAGTPSAVTREAVDESTRYEAFVYEAGITVNPLDFIKVYAKYGTQFKYPYLDDYVFLNPGNLTATVAASLEPEKGCTAEGGIGLNFKKLVKFDANFYYMKIDIVDQQKKAKRKGRKDDIYNKAYSLDFRKQAVAYTDRGYSFAELREAFNIFPSAHGAGCSMKPENSAPGPAAVYEYAPSGFSRSISPRADVPPTASCNP
jgi:outer membrane receptor protein involved in Fe transport